MTMNDLLIALFRISWGTVSLMELLWTLGALAGGVACFFSIRRSQQKSRFIHQGIDDYTRLLANRSILIRNGMLGVVLEVIFFAGAWGMLEPPAPNLPPTVAVLGFVFWLLELAVIFAVVYEEFAGILIRRHLDWLNAQQRIYSG
jgi:hypothetical protein